MRNEEKCCTSTEDNMNNGINAKNDGKVILTMPVGPSDSQEPWRYISPSERRAILGFPQDIESPIFIYGCDVEGNPSKLDERRKIFREKFSGLRVYLVSGEQFVREIVNLKLREDRFREFREKYNNMDILMFEDIDALEGHPVSQEEFRLMFETFYRLGKLIVLTAKNSPKEYAKTKRIEVFDEEMIEKIQLGRIVKYTPGQIFL